MFMAKRKRRKRHRISSTQSRQYGRPRRIQHRSIHTPLTRSLSHKGRGSPKCNGWKKTKNEEQQKQGLHRKYRRKKSFNNATPAITIQKR
jgi:hypothetical protein